MNIELCTGTALKFGNTYIYIHTINYTYVTLHYIALHCITLHYITLQYITLHHITLHYIHIYIWFKIYIQFSFRSR